eukprot:scaffold116177_cov14-Prasinocladus_malaysianus.AAC.1
MLELRLLRPMYGHSPVERGVRSSSSDDDDDDDDDGSSAGDVPASASDDSLAVWERRCDMMIYMHQSSINH